jgi:hypothetical protein
MKVLTWSLKLEISAENLWQRMHQAQSHLSSCVGQTNLATRVSFSQYKTVTSPSFHFDMYKSV